ncbi:MAG: glucoamylase family protein, partial [Ardenticatenaceae bacterium]
MTQQQLLDRLQEDTFGYFLHERNAANGLVPDNTGEDSPASTTAVGLALAAYTVGVERGFIARDEAVARALTTLRFFWNSPQSEEPDATGYKGFYYHFLDMESGRRVWESELSTIDTTFLLAGALAAGHYFDHDTAKEREIRSLADALYRRADWQWMLDGGRAVSHGWKPESGFLGYRWEGYSEAILLYALGLGSPTYPLPVESYAAFTAAFVWKRLYGYDFLYAGPLFIHQLSHVWIDFRGIQDAFMRAKGLDYFENSRRATYVQREYAIRNPGQFKGYGENAWGITASAGPGPATCIIDGVEREFFGYLARAVPDGPDDGTLAPWGAAASLPFAPEVVV